MGKGWQDVWAQGGLGQFIAMRGGRMRDSALNTAEVQAECEENPFFPSLGAVSQLSRLPRDFVSFPSFKGC